MGADGIKREEALSHKKVYFVTTHRNDEIAVLRKVKPPRLLCSYWYFKNRPLDAFCENLGYKPEIMLDSGAYSAHASGKNINLLDFYRQKALLLRITPPQGDEYGITPADLDKALGDREWHPWMVINALGNAADGYQPGRKIYLTLEAVDHLVKNGVKVLFSDAWESVRLDGVFLRLFDSGVSAVCNLVNLNKLPADKEFLLTMSFLPYPGAVTQIPASVIAEI